MIAEAFHNLRQITAIKLVENKDEKVSKETQLKSLSLEAILAQLK